MISGILARDKATLYRSDMFYWKEKMFKYGIKVQRDL